MHHWWYIVFLSLAITGTCPWFPSAGAEFSDPCKAKTRPCFQSYLDSGTIPEDELSDEFVNTFMVSPEACLAERDTGDCVMNILVNCSEEFRYYEEFGGPIYVGDIIRDMLCETVTIAECTGMLNCEHDAHVPGIGEQIDYPTGGYVMWAIVGLALQICNEYCLPAMGHCPAISTLYARINVQKLPILLHQDDMESTMVAFQNLTCPLTHDLLAQCSVDSMASTNFTKCLDAALHDYPNVVMFLNQAYVPALSAELIMNCWTLERLQDCIQTYVGSECNEQSARITIDGLFLLGFAFNMSTCETVTENYHGNGAITVAMGTTASHVILSMFWLIMH